MKRKLPKDIQKIIIDYLESSGKGPIVPNEEQAVSNANAYYKFCEDITPYLSDDLKPCFLNESTEKWIPGVPWTGCQCSRCRKA